MTTVPKFSKPRCCQSSDCIEVAFQTSSYCDSGACVEVGFHKSTRSSTNGSCVEAKICTCNEILVRDSKDPDGPVLTFNRDEWAAFLAGVKNKEFELPIA